MGVGPGTYVPSTPPGLLPLMVLAGAFTPLVLLATLGGRWLRRRARRRRAVRLETAGRRWSGQLLGGAGERGWSDEASTRVGRRTAGALATTRSDLMARAGRAGGMHRAAGDGRRPWLSVESAAPVLAGLGAAALLPSAFGVMAGVAAALLLRRLLPVIRSADRRAAREQDLLLAQLPLTAELLAACLGSSAAPAQAAEAVARTIGDPMRTRLNAVSAELALGAPPAACWERLGDECPALEPLARCLVRTTVSGAPPAAPLTGLALAQRAAAGRAAHARVRRAGVLATAPLGLCFLPAFVLIGVVPVVVGLAAAFSQRL
ncbi:type II secretion system F family protein [Kitasatospora sp. GAS1066B]|uniref:type II secretion system F family protein n=1 Tax=Kitasatospora sp. GAS1066B TaxID=3156271 RepID=UPI0035110E75